MPDLEAVTVEPLDGGLGGLGLLVRDGALALGAAGPLVLVHVDGRFAHVVILLRLLNSPDLTKELDEGIHRDVGGQALHEDSVGPRDGAVAVHCVAAREATARRDVAAAPVGAGPLLGTIVNGNASRLQAWALCVRARVGCAWCWS